MIERNNITLAAAQVAQQLHQGQVDKAGIDYFSGHLTKVANMGVTWQEQVLGYLHDASEDTPCTVDEVLEMLDEALTEPLPDADRKEIAIALHLLNHHTVSDRSAYILAIGENPLATAVKLNDLTHNMDLTRLPNPTEKDYARIERYKTEYNYLIAKKISNSKYGSE